MSAPYIIDLLPDFLKTPEFDQYAANLLNQPVTDSPFTLGEIFGNDSTRRTSFLQQTYIQQLAEQGNEEAQIFKDSNPDFVEKYNLNQELIERYRDPKDPERLRYTEAITPVQAAGVRDSLFPTRREQMQLPTVEPSSFTEKERFEIASYGVDPDFVFEGNKSFLDRYLSEAGITALAPFANPMAGQFLEVNQDSPWRIKAFFSPSVLTPKEAAKLLEKESPNAKFRYIDPRRPEMGIAIMDETTDGKFVPLRPLQGNRADLEAVIQFIGEETATLVLEGLGSKGLGRLIGEAGTQATTAGRFGRGMAESANVGVAAGLGRFAQLAYGRVKNINDISFKDAFDDAGLAAALGFAGSTVTGAALATTGRIWQSITGEAIPDEIIDRLRAGLEKYNRKGTSEEFTSEELTRRTRQAADAVGENIEYTPTFGELTQDNFLKALELELFAQTATTAKGRKVFENVLENNSNAAFNFWTELTKKAPELEDISYTTFRNFLAKRQKQLAEQAERAAKQSISDIEAGVKLDTALPDQPPVQMLTVDELGSTFTRNQEDGSLLYRRNTPEFTAQFDEAYNAAKDAVSRQIDVLGDLSYDTAEESISLVSPAFQKIYDTDATRQTIMRTLGDVEASDVLKSMIPMRDGVSVLRQLLGETTDKEGAPLEALNLNFGQLAGMQNALNSLFMQSPDRSVREAADSLREAVETQMDDLLMVEARRRLATEGINNPTPPVLTKKLEEIAGPLIEANKELRVRSQSIERKWLKDFVTQEPNQIADFVLSSSPKQVTQLMDQIYLLPDSIVRLQNLRQLVLERMRKEFDGMPLVEQNKAYTEFLEKNEEQLQALFPESDFLQITSFKDAQEKAIQEVARITEDLTQLEKELGKKPADFIKDFLLTGSSARATGAADTSREEFGELVQDNPALRPYIKALVKDFFKGQYETTRTGRDTMFEVGGFDVDALTRFVNSDMPQGPTGTAKLAAIFKPLFGDEEGAKYAQDLRMLQQLLSRGAQRASRSPQQQGPIANQTIDDHLQELTFATRLFIAPLTPDGRRLTAAVAGYRDRAKSDVLEILADPQKLRRLLEKRESKMSRREFYKFLGGVAAAREFGPDIGSETQESPVDRVIKKVRGPIQDTQDIIRQSLDIIRSPGAPI